MHVMHQTGAINRDSAQLIEFFRPAEWKAAVARVRSALLAELRDADRNHDVGRRLRAGRALLRLRGLL